MRQSLAPRHKHEQVLVNFWGNSQNFLFRYLNKIYVDCVRMELVQRGSIQIIWISVILILLLLLYSIWKLISAPMICLASSFIVVVGN